MCYIQNSGWVIFFFPTVLEGSESSIHNSHMEVIRRFTLVPHAGAKPLSSGLKANVVILNAPGPLAAWGLVDMAG